MLGLGAPELAQLARNAVNASYLTADRKQTLLKEIDTLTADI
ncbi:hypothetical protein ACNF49_22815 [Actinomadura sp. ATCC 39365]